MIFKFLGTQITEVKMKKKKIKQEKNYKIFYDFFGFFFFCIFTFKTFWYLYPLGHPELNLTTFILAKIGLRDRFYRHTTNSTNLQILSFVGGGESALR